MEDLKMFKRFCLILLAVLIAGCAGVKKESILDTPENHYNMGEKSLKAGNYQNALLEFTRAKDLKEDFYQAYEGMAIAYSELGDIKSAKESISKCEGYLRLKMTSYTPLYVAKGRVYLKENKFKDAMDEFEEAVDDFDEKTQKAEKVEAYIWLGKAQGLNYDFEDSEKNLRKALELDPSNAWADRELEEVSKLKRATAGMSKEMLIVAKSSEMTRAEVAVLFALELPFDKIFRGNPAGGGFSTPSATEQTSGASPQTATDVPDNYWAKTYIDKVLGNGIMEKYPDGSFQPDKKINRAEYAMFIQSFLEKATNDPSLPTKFIGSESGFSDVPGSHWAHNAVMVVTTRGIMKAKLDGTFGLMDTVPGADAILVIRVLKDQFK
jgi:tetratricopeptide (TPR) repeat protein